MKNLLTVFVSVFVMSSCSMMGSMDHGKMNHGDMKMMTDVQKASAVIVATQGNNVKGMVTFTAVEGGVRVQAEVSGLEPNTKHGFHIHQYGDLSSADGTAMAGHFNPMNMDHSDPNSAVRHVGDLGNLVADVNGKAVVDYVDKVISLHGSSCILGRGVVVHAKEDDLKTQPTGNAGARIGQGVIGVVKP